MKVRTGKWKRYIGDKAFYSLVFAVAIPIMIQNGITNFVGLLDNIMIGRVGTEQMSGIAIVNQLIIVFNISIFGAISGAGIFGAQFFGCKDIVGVRNTFRFKVYSCFFLLVISVGIFFFKGEELVLLYLHGEGNGEALEATLKFGVQYLNIMLLGLFPFALEQAYTSSMRECGETIMPMKAGVLSVFLNFFLNIILIFGFLGFPKLGVVGAAIATVIARYIQAIVVVIWTHKNKEKMKFIEGAYASFKIPMNLVGKILMKGTPLMINEVMWSVGMALLTQCYSIRGLESVAGMNIASTIGNLFNVVFIAMGSAISIMIGQLLGAGKLEEAKDTDRKLIVATEIACVFLGIILLVVAPLFPMLYNTEQSVKNLATAFIRIFAIYLPLSGFMNAAYFTLRSGGKTGITFFFDSVIMWCIKIPAAYLLSRYTLIPVVPLFFICQMLDIVKCSVGYILVKKGVWIKQLI